ncbi:MAG: prolyl oligopeptidase family serine peptidase [Bacteroidales bacterium]|nr:prolyl oligopeptidase family serine peptidase [Bacteroidales bacterium]
MKKKLLIVLGLMIFASQVFSQKQLIVETENYPLGCDTVNYYLPENYSSFKKYPAVILLHGYDGSFRQWGNICNLQKLSNEFSMILICPDGFKESWYLDSPIRPSLRYASFFREDLLPKLKQNLPLDSTALFITGLSMGGHGALYLFCLNHKEFKAAGSISGVLDLKASSVSFSIAKVLGVKNKTNTNWDKYSVINMTDSLKNAGKPLIVNCGSQDFLIGVNRKFAQKCEQEKIKIVFTESPGKHNRDYWRALLPEQLRYFRQFVKKDTN